MPTIEPYRDTKLPERFLRWIETLRLRLRPVPDFFQGAGSPEGVLTATLASHYFNTTGSPGTRLYVKTTNSGNTGWQAYG